MTETNSSLGGYPLGAENDPRAPYNQKDPELIPINVTVSVTYSRTVKVMVEKEHTDKDLCDAVRDLEILPKDILDQKADAIQEDIDTNNWLFTGAMLDSLIEERDNLRKWHEDELEVIEYDFNSDAHWQ